jgi:hypothetical protein
MDSAALDIAISALEKEISRLELSIDGLEKWLWISSAAVAVGVIFEIVFIVHEYLEDREGWRHGIISSPSRPSFRLLLFEIVSVVVVVAGIVGELWVGVVSSNRNTDLRSKNNRLVSLVREKAGDAQIAAGDAVKDAGSAKERAGKLEVQAATLRKQAEDERTARVKIEARVAWRRLTEQQKAEIGSSLGRRFSNQGVSFWYDAGAIETSWFAADIAEAVQEAKTLRVYPPGALMKMMESGRLGAPVRRVETGVTVQSTKDDRSRQLADAIIHELTVRGFDAVRQTDPPFDPNPAPQVWVYIEPRPDGPQGEFKLATQRDVGKKTK